MKTSNVLKWLENLPAVDGGAAQNDLFAAKRGEVVALLAKAESLSGNEAASARNEAYLAVLKIESDARKVWGDQEIISAKAKGL